MDLTTKLSLWGTTHAAARKAAQEAERERGPYAEAWRREAQQLRQRAERLHREIYSELGRQAATASSSADSSPR